MGQQFHHHNSKILICGKTGNGKTTYGLRYVTNSQYDYHFIFDGESELAARMGIRPCYTPDELLAAVPGRWIIYDPIRSHSNPLDGCKFFCEWSFYMCEQLPGEKQIVIDELWKYTNSHVVPPELELPIFTGRRAGIDSVFLSQRPNRIHNSIRDSLSEVVCFKLQDKNSLEFVVEQGLCKEEVRALRPGQFIALNVDYGTLDRGSVF